MNSPLHHQVNAVLERFAAHVGLSVCTLDEEGGAQLALDDVLVSLLVDDSAGTLLLLSSIGQPEPTVQTYASLLDANLFWSGTGGATLAREASSGSIVLQHALPVAGLDLDPFETALQGFVDTVEWLRAVLEADGAPIEPAETNGRALTPQHVIRA